jgi:hypothetical protein
MSVWRAGSAVSGETRPTAPDAPRMPEGFETEVEKDGWRN